MSHLGPRCNTLLHPYLLRKIQDLRVRVSLLPWGRKALLLVRLPLLLSSLLLLTFQKTEVFCSPYSPLSSIFGLDRRSETMLPYVAQGLVGEASGEERSDLEVAALAPIKGSPQLPPSIIDCVRRGTVFDRSVDPPSGTA